MNRYQHAARADEILAEVEAQVKRRSAPEHGDMPADPVRRANRAAAELGGLVALAEAHAALAQALVAVQ